MFRAVILGAPASGKGTISSRITKAFDILHLSSGDLLRNSKIDLGKEAGELINKGKLVSDAAMLKIMFSELDKLQAQSWLLDGFPRTRAQGDALMTKYKLHMAIALDVPVEEIVQRVKGRWIHMPSGRIYNETFHPPKVARIDDITGEALVQRPDDSPEVVRERLRSYSETIRPLLNFYSECGILRTFAGRSSDEIWPKVRAAIPQHLELKQSKK